MRFDVRSIADAQEVLTYFNGFHDGFVRCIAIQVNPESAEGFGFAFPVRYDGLIQLEHNNYRAAEERGAISQIVVMRAGRIMSMRIGDLIAYDNMLQECSITIGDDGLIRVDIDGLIHISCSALEISEAEVPS